jgi:alpha-glucosidase
MPLPPLYSLGYQQSRYSYYPEARVRQVAQEFRRRKIPADVIYLDLDYEDGARPFTIDRKRFPQFEGMVADLKAEGFKLVVITDLHLKKEPGYKPYDEGLAGDHFVKNPDGSLYVGRVWPGDCVFPDFTREQTRQWFGTLYADFMRMGIRGFWDDMNEPAVFAYPVKTMPLDTVHRVDGRTATHREIHNVYGMENARATYEGMLRLQPNLRPFVLTRAGFAGTQRYAAAWTGDNAATWSHYRLTVPTLLSLGISGMPFVGVDVGGFAGTPTPELLTRWMELGAFLPFYRNHTDTGTADQEPWVHGPEHEAIRRRYIETRYRLLPYIYTQMEEASRDGVPLMRPLFLEFPEEASLVANDSEFMLGDALLVAPKLWETLDPYEVKLPPGQWYDYWNGDPIEGGKKLKVNPPLDTLPVYVRGGAILPHQPLVQNTDETPQGALQLRVYPGENCHGALYQDDGSTFAYTQGQFLRVTFSCLAAPHELRVRMSAIEGAYKPWWNTVQLQIVGITASPHQVMAGGITTSEWTFDAASKSMVVTIPAASQGSEVVITE